MQTIKRLKRLVRELPLRWRNAKWSYRLRNANLYSQLRTGINPEFHDWADWSVFWESFVEGDYDDASRETLAAADAQSGVNVLDVGANIGFFAMRLLHLRRQEMPDARCRIHQFEACRRTFANLQRRMGRIALESGKEELKMHFGAVGKRSGSMWIAANPFHAMSTGSLEDGSGEEVPFIDLEQILPAPQPVHLLKCDIEGGEVWLIENYEALLRRVQRAVIEFHLDRCDHADCLQRLQRCGLERKKVIDADSYTSTEYFVNPKA